MASVQMVVFLVFLLTSPVITHGHDHHDVRCRHDQFRCVTVAKCIPYKWKCDGGTDCPDKSDEKECGSWLWTAGVMLAGGALTVVAAPVVVAGLGFGAAGIGAGTVAAGAMSTAATTGVGMGVVSTLQAVGATGALTLAQSAVVGGLGTGVSKVVCDKVSSDKDKGQNDDKGEKADNGEPEDKDEDEDQGKRKDEDKDNN